MSSKYKTVKPYRQIEHVIINELIPRDIGGFCS